MLLLLGVVVAHGIRRNLRSGDLKRFVRRNIADRGQGSQRIAKTSVAAHILQAEIDVGGIGIGIAFSAIVPAVVDGNVVAVGAA